jgi:hypothetical protein
LKNSRTPVTDSHIARNVPAKWDKRLVISASFIQPHDHYSIKTAVVCEQTPLLNYQIMVNLANVRQHLKLFLIYNNTHYTKNITDDAFTITFMIEFEFFFLVIINLM